MFSIAPFLSYVFVTTFTPGPNNIMAMSNANQHGFKKTINFILGMTLGFALIMLLCSYFNLILFNIMPKIKFFMSILGAVYMTYLALKILLSKPKAQGKDDSKASSFVEGLALQFLNPKVILFGITVISNFIIPNFRSNLLLILFSIFLAFIGFLATTSWAFFGAVFQRFLAKYSRIFNAVMGLLLIYSAISLTGLI